MSVDDCSNSDLSDFISVGDLISLSDKCLFNGVQF